MVKISVVLRAICVCWLVTKSIASTYTVPSSLRVAQSSVEAESCPPTVRFALGAESAESVVVTTVCHATHAEGSTL